jgi:hypothetical protein
VNQFMKTIALFCFTLSSPAWSQNNFVFKHELFKFEFLSVKKENGFVKFKVIYTNLQSMTHHGL